MTQLFIGAVRRHSRKPINGLDKTLKSEPMEWDDVIAWMNAQFDVLNPQIAPDWMVSDGIRMKGNTD